MPKQIEALYKQLAKADKDLSAAQQNYVHLQDQLTELESLQHAGHTTITNLQNDIDALNFRLINNEIAVSNECAQLEETYGDLLPGNSLPDTFEELISLRGQEKNKADQELKRIAQAHGGSHTDYSLDSYLELESRRDQYEQEIFEAQLNYGQLPETKEKLYALNETDPRDKQTIDVIRNLLSGDHKDLAASSQKTWEETKQQYEAIETDYTAIRSIQKVREAQIQNILKADLNTLRQQQNAQAAPGAEIITEDSLTLINGALHKNADSLGIHSLREYFEKERELLASRPDTSVIDELPAVTHFFTDLAHMDAEAAKRARNITNSLITRHRETHPQPEGAASSIEDYEHSQNMQEVWTHRREQLAKHLTNHRTVPSELAGELPEGELKSSIAAYNQAQTEKADLELKLAIHSFDQYPVKVTQIKDLKASRPLEYNILSAKIKALAEDDSKTLISSLSGRSYDADMLIREHTEMRALETKNRSKKELLTDAEHSRLKELQGRVREMKDRLEADKKSHTNLLGHRIQTADQTKKEQDIREALDQKHAAIKILAGNISGLADGVVAKYTEEAKAKKDYIKHTVVESEQKDAFNKKKAFEKNAENHRKLTAKVDGVLEHLKKEQLKKQEQQDKALQKDEALAKAKNKDAYVNAESTRSMIEIIKAENIARKANIPGQHKLKDITATNQTAINQINHKLDDIRTSTEAWIKEDKEARTKNIQRVNKGVTDEISERIKTAKKEARKAGTEAKVLGFVSQKVGTFTDLYRKKIKEISDGMIKAPRMEKEAQLAALQKQLGEARSSLAAMDRNQLDAARSAADQAKTNLRLNHASNDVSDIITQITKVNKEIQAMKPLEEKHLQENNAKFHQIFGDIIPTDREQMRKASEAKRACEIEAAHGDQAKIDLANAEFELRKTELDAQFDKEDLDAQITQNEICEINAKSDEWGQVLNENTKSRIDTLVTVGEKILNFAVSKTQGEAAASEAGSPINIRESLNAVKEGLSSSGADSEHVVDQLLEIGELVYHKLQDVNQTLDTKYQDASRQHAAKQNLCDALEQDHKQFQDACEKDSEHKMGVSLKDKRIAYLNDRKKKVDEQLSRNLLDKKNAATNMQKQVADLSSSLIPDKEHQLFDAAQTVNGKIAHITNLENQLDQLRDDHLEQYRKNLSDRHMTDKQISRSAEGIRIDPSRPASSAELIGQLTNTELNAGTSLEDTMEQIRKINVNGIGLINFINPQNQYSGILSAGETEQLAFKEKLLQGAGTFLKNQLGSSILSVEQDDLLLHPVLLDGNAEFNSHTRSMVADFNAVRLESAKLNVMMRTPPQTAAEKQQPISDRDKQLQQTLDKAVKQSRSRLSFASLLQEEGTEKNKRPFDLSDRTQTHNKTAGKTPKGLTR